MLIKKQDGAEWKPSLAAGTTVPDWLLAWALRDTLESENRKGRRARAGLASLLQVLAVNKMVGLVCKRIVQLTNVPVPCNYSWPVIALPEFSIHYSYIEEFFFPGAQSREEEASHGQGYMGFSSAGSW